MMWNESIKKTGDIIKSVISISVQLDEANKSFGVWGGDLLRF